MLGGKAQLRLPNRAVLVSAKTLPFQEVNQNARFLCSSESKQALNHEPHFNPY
jgi:hypothetical protein